MKLWDVASGNPLQSHATTLCMYSVSFSGDGRRFAATGGAYHPNYRLKNRGEIWVWDARSGKQVFSSTNISSCVYSVALSPDGRRLVAAVGVLGENGPFDVKLWDVDAAREILTLGRHAKTVEGVAFSPNGKRIASGGKDKVIKIWSID